VVTFEPGGQYMIQLPEHKKTSSHHHTRH
jgi:hypothetical protein